MINCVPLEDRASKDLRALLSCTMGPGHLRKPLNVSNVGLMLRVWITSWCRVRQKCPDSAGNELGAVLRHDDAVTGFLCTLQSA